MSGDVDAGFAHGLDHRRVEAAGLKPGALGREAVAADLIQERLGHLAAGAVVDADKEDALLVHRTRRKWVQCSLLITKYNVPASSAAHGSVTIHERTMPMTVLTFAWPVVTPMPKSAPTETWVVETGRP